MDQFDASVPDYLRDPSLLEGSDSFTAGIGSARGPHVTLRNGRFFFVGSDGSEQMCTLYDPNHGPYIDVVFVGANPGVSKVYYEGAYVQGEKQAPTCFSNDGRFPDASATVRQAPSCAACAWSVWGSETTQAGKQAKACSDRKRTAVLNVQDIKGPLYEVSLSPSNLKPFAEYATNMKGRGLPLAGIVTRVSVNPAVVGGMVFNAAINPQTGAGVWFVPPQVAPLIGAAKQSIEYRKALGLDAQPAAPMLAAPAHVPQIQHHNASGAAPIQQTVTVAAPLAQPQTGSGYAPAATVQTSQPTGAPFGQQPSGMMDGTATGASSNAGEPQRKRRTKAEMEAARAAQQSPQMQPQPQQVQQPYQGTAGIALPQDPGASSAQSSSTAGFAGFGSAPSNGSQGSVGFAAPVNQGFGAATHAMPAQAPQADFGVVTQPQAVPPELDAMLAQLR